MALLSELQPAIAVALNSLGGKMTKVSRIFTTFTHRATSTPLLMPSSFCVGSTASMVRACWCAPQSKLCYASKRFALKHTSLYRVLLREALEADKWFGSVARRHGVAYTHVCDRDEWQAFKDRCIAQFGADKLEDVPT